MVKKIQRQKWEVHKFKEKAGFKDRHHLKNCSKGGSTSKANLLKLDAYKHDAWHLLFENKNLDEVIDLLIRIKQIKTDQRLKAEAETLFRLVEHLNFKRLKMA